MTLSEDYRVNRLEEALDLFEEISTSEFFQETGPSHPPLITSSPHQLNPPRLSLWTYLTHVRLLHVLQQG